MVKAWLGFLKKRKPILILLVLTLVVGISSLLASGGAKEEKVADEKLEEIGAVAVEESVEAAEPDTSAPEVLPAPLPEVPAIREPVAREQSRPQITEPPAPITAAPKPTVTSNPAPKPAPKAQPAPVTATPAPAPPAPIDNSLSVASIISRINYERARNGLPALRENALLNLAASRKSLDMDTNNYFSHTAPDGRSDFEFVKAAGYQYRQIGSNLAMGDFNTAEALVTAWMNSAGHRANLLASYGVDAGIGIAGEYFTMFVAKPL